MKCFPTTCKSFFSTISARTNIQKQHLPTQIYNFLSQERLLESDPAAPEGPQVVQYVVEGVLATLGAFMEGLSREPVVWQPDQRRLLNMIIRRATMLVTEGWPAVMNDHQVGPAALGSKRGRTASQKCEVYLCGDRYCELRLIKHMHGL
jgi:hypothetical protein